MHDHLSCDCHHEHCHDEHCDHHGHEHDGGCSCGCGHEHSEDTPWRLLIAFGLFLAGVFVPGLFSWPTWVQGIWMMVAAFYTLISVFREAMEELKDRRMGENTLLVIAVVAAFAIGEWLEGTLVVLLFSLGEWLEGKAMVYSRRRIEALATVTPDEAYVADEEGKVQSVSATAVLAGQRIVLPPHTRVPVDCRVLEGNSAMDAAAITGESTPLAVEPGAELLSGMLNGSGYLTAVALRESGESAAARILSMVENAVGRKGQSEKFITRFARIYTPVVTLLAVVVAVLPPLCTGDWLTWLYRALVFLVASCPCALVISVPLSFYAGIAAAARRGVLIKGGCFVETLAKVQAVAFDKTGTLTTGEMALRQVLGENTKEALSLAAALERYSSHPVARAICAAAPEGAYSLEAVQERPGIGVEALWQGKRVACGGMRLLLEAGIVPPNSLAHGNAFLLIDNQVQAAFVMDTQLQKGAEETIPALQKLGISRLQMLTGDRLAPAEAVARAVGLSADAVQAELLPEDKLAAVQSLKSAGYVTAFVGDGINDAPVLAAADVGIAMGLGSPVAIETADVVLVAEGVQPLSPAVKLCRRVMATVCTNIAFALSVKAAVLILAVCGIAPMWLAVFADMGVTLLAVANALRLLITK